MRTQRTSTRTHSTPARGKNQRRRAANSLKRKRPPRKTRFAKGSPAPRPKKKPEYRTVSVRNPKTKKTVKRRIKRKKLDEFYIYNDASEVYYKKHRVLTREKLKNKEFKKESRLGYHRLYWVHAIYLASYQGMTLEEFSATGNFYEASEHGLESGLDMCERQVYAQVRSKYGFATGAELVLMHYDVGYRKEYLLNERGSWSRRIDENNDERR